MFKKILRISGELCESAYNICYNHPQGTVLMLHRIGDWDFGRLECIENLKVSTQRMQLLVDKYRRTHDFVTLDYVADCLEGKTRPQRPYICVTLDDGFRDNLSLGLPFFEKHHIPFTVFLTVDWINRRPAFNYPFILERIIWNNDSLMIKGKTFACRTRLQKNEVFKQLKSIVQNIPYVSFENTFRDLFEEYLKPEYEEDIMMNWNEVRELSNSELCTIGSHTMTHCRLANLSDSQLTYELAESKKQIEQQIDREIHHISYPFGWKSDVNEKSINMARDIGYRMGLISWGGPMRRRDKDMYQVKRQMLLEHE